ncbi:hypothetical protein [Brevibacillus sp. SYSU BS000544]|uniref:hypothetical protein n=1 Tax=Brevibacillus sp. SYSU BS000544 TaxID=3416443 RepID=UPI003CE51B9C
MKVLYTLKNEVPIAKVKEMLKPFGGRCAKVVEGKLEYQIKDDQEKAAYAHLSEQGIVE